MSTTATKPYFHNVKLMGASTVLDKNDNVISLTSDERNAIANAYGGPVSTANPLVSKNQHDSDLESLKAGLRWKPPVNYVADTPKSEAPVVGDRYLNTSDNKIYNCTEASSWNLVEDPEPNWVVFDIETDEEWTYDSDTTTWVMKSSGSIPYASETQPGKVRFAPNGGTNALEAVQGNDSRLIKGYYAVTLTNPTDNTVINHQLNSSKIFIQAWASDENVSLSVKRDTDDPNNKLVLGVEGILSSVDIFIIALP